MSIPPLLSSTPPPLDENGSAVDHDEDDEFGEFSDYATAGAVSSTTSITDAANLFKPVESTEPSDGLCSVDGNTKPGCVEEFDEGLEYDAPAQPSSEPAESDSVDLCKNRKSKIDGSGSDGECVENPPINDFDERTTAEPVTASLSAAPVLASKQSNSGDVLRSCCSDVEVECNDADLDCHEETVSATVGDVNSRSCSSAADAVSEETSSGCEGGEIEQLVSEAGITSVCSSAEQTVEIDNTVDLATEDDDKGHIDSHPVYTGYATSENGDDCNDKRSISDENDFADDFQSFSNELERDLHAEPGLEETQFQVPNCGDSASVSSSSEENTSTNVEAVAVDTVASRAADSEVTCSASEIAVDSTIEKQADITCSSQLSTGHELIASGEEADDDFDDFEEFVAAADRPVEEQASVDPGAYQWSAFENTAADGSDWAAFEDADQHSSRSEIADSTVAHTNLRRSSSFSQLSKESLAQSLNACFQLSTMTESDTRITPVHRVLECKDTREPSDGAAVWKGLRLMENTPALKYQWQQSHCHDQLLRAINIDARNILNPPRRSAPAFATNLGLLEPKKAAVPDQLGPVSTDCSVHSLPLSVEHVWQRQSDDVSQSVRPVDAKKQEKELLEVLELPDSRTGQTVKSHSSPLDSILKAITSTTVTSNTSLATTAQTKDGVTEPLSAEASSVLSRLPDLSFMHSKVLMFPVSDCAN